MVPAWSKKKVLIAIFVIGSLWRILLFVTSPPSNSYDDHLEAIASYADTYERPNPSECWECYQPPAYYTSAAGILNFSKLAIDDNYWSWKIVQLINPVLSILMLFFFLKIIHRLRLTDLQKVLYLSFIAVLPRDMFTATMIGNDYLLVFSSVAAFYFYLRSLGDVQKNGDSIKNFALLCLFVCLGGITKQHGLLLIALPLYPIYLSWKNNRRVTPYLLLYLSVCTIVFTEELWKYSKTGEWLVSNQQFFDHTEGQFPGALHLVEFYSIKIIELFNNPFIAEKTAASFPTEIFARIFFDYEWRFLVPEIPQNIWLGRCGYLLGMIWLLYFVFSSLFSLKRNGWLILSKVSSSIIVPLVIYGLFFLVPMIQTLRFPYYSSMKAMFLLPGLIVLIALHGKLVRPLTISKKVVSILVVLNVIYGTFLVISIYSFLDISLSHLHGPQWPLPE